jgi:predicted dehydrogenase
VQLTEIVEVNQHLRTGMIGGGPGAFMGPVHRIATELDRELELVAGVFSSDARRSRAAANAHRVDPARAFADAAAMFAGEAARDDGIDFVTIARPNHHHLPAARAALATGVAVMSDKPMTALLFWPGAETLGEHEAQIVAASTCDHPVQRRGERTRRS